MKAKRKKVLCVDADVAFLENQKKALGEQDLEDCFFGFTDFWEALHFIEKQIIARNKKLHYILLDEKIPGKQLAATLEKLAGLKNFLKKPEIIVCTSNNSNDLRNQVMQYHFVSALLEKPIPENYIGFLITGQAS
jgi:CheY-like chemotaxis protein